MFSFLGLAVVTVCLHSTKTLTKTTALIPALTGQRQEDLCELTASLVCILSSQLAGAPYRDPVLGEKERFSHVIITSGN